MNNKVLIVIVLVVIALVAAWYFMWRQPSVTVTPENPTAQGLGTDIYKQVAPTSTSNLPETNPFKAVQTNPFK